MVVCQERGRKRKFVETGDEVSVSSRELEYEGGVRGWQVEDLSSETRSLG